MSPAPFPLFAFGFGNLAMLGWLAAAAAPVIIHLLSRRRQRRMPWAAMEHLLAAIRQSSRRLRLEQFLLLAVRTLLIVSVILAMAEPYLRPSALAVMSGRRTHHLIVLDASYSMGYTPTDKTRLEHAKEVAAQIVKQSPQGDGFTLILMASPPRVVVGTPALDRNDFLRQIDAAPLLHTAADLPATLGRVEEVLRAARREQPRLTGQEVCFLTDLGRVGWVPAFRNATAMTSFRQRAERIAREASVVVIDFGQSGVDNLAVTDVRTLEPVATTSRNVVVQADVRSFGRQAQPRQAVELLADGRQVKQETVEIAPGGQASVTFSHRFESPGDHTLEVRAPGDALDVDNRRFLALEVKQAIQVLCIDGDPSGGSFEGAADYLAFALEPLAGSTRATVRAEIALESALSERDLRAFDGIFLCNVAQFTAGEAQRLDDYLRTGGGLVFFLGDRVQPDRYNAELAGDGPSGVRILPARLGPLVAQMQTRLDPLGYGHPIVQPFEDRERAGLLTTPVYAYYRLEPGEGSKAKVALAVAGGDPLIVEEPIRRGRVVLVATSADRSWTPMPLLPSYLPIVQEILAFAIGGRNQQRNVEVGRPLGGVLPAAAGESPIALRTPDGRNLRIRPRIDGDQVAWEYADTMLSGLYAAEIVSPTPRRASYAVNLDTVESDLTKVAAEELRGEIWPDVPFVYQTTWEDTQSAPAAPIARRSPLPGTLLVAALALLLTDTLLAWRFGYHTA